MKRALRRHQQAVAKARKIRILRHRWGWPWSGRRKPWKQLGRLVMNEPGYWVHEFMIQPMRIHSNRQLRLIEKGYDPDLFQWRDGKKPHVYYW